jgi:hypothetical protein
MHVARRDGLQTAAAAITVSAPTVAPRTLRSEMFANAPSALGSGALRADARQADFCHYLSAIAIPGLLLNHVMGDDRQLETSDRTGSSAKPTVTSGIASVISPLKVVPRTTSNSSTPRRPLVPTESTSG